MTQPSKPHNESSQHGQSFLINGARKFGSDTKSLPLLIDPPSYDYGITGVAGERQINDKTPSDRRATIRGNSGRVAQRNTH